MASSTDFITTMASFYASSLRSGLAYNFAYDLALANTAKQYNFSCTPSLQELKLRLIINPNGCFGLKATPFLESATQENSKYPPEIVKLIAILGPEVAQQRLTELFVSALDGTLIQNGMNETAVNSIVAKMLDYIAKGCINVRLACECDNASQDPCRVVSSMTVGKNARYALPKAAADELTEKVENLINNISGTNYEIENLTVRELNEIERIFEDTLNILYNNNQISVDPNSGEVKAVIDDFFDQAKERNPQDRTKIMGFDGGDFAVLLSLLNSNGQFPRIASVYSRLMNRLSNKLGRLASVSTQNNSFVITPDYSANSVLFSSVVQFESKNVSCDPNKYPLSSPDSKINITCECKEEKPDRCSISFLANVVTKPMIYEVPYFYASGRAVAELPTPPDVQFIPYKDVDNTLLINLNTTAGKYTTKFVPITMEDEDYLSRLASSRGISTDALFDFEGDPDVQYYEAFRIDFHPTTYKDFSLAEMYTFQNYRDGFDRFRNRSVFRDVDIKAYSNAISQEHSFMPNKKYYYIFRTIDINDNISNPSKVFEVEMINNGGAIFPVIRTVDFLKPKVLTDKAEMRRLMLLTPARSQTDILSISTEMVEDLGYTSAADAVRNLKLSSAAENSIWDKRFKIRFTSLDTGRMLDININPTVRIVDPTNLCGPKGMNNNPSGQGSTT